MISKRLLMMTMMLFALPAETQADLLSDLTELREACDRKLLTAEECAKRRQKILDDRYDGARERPEEIEWFCNYDGSDDVPNEFAAAGSQEYSESASAGEIVKEMLDEAGLAPNFIVRPANVRNASASIRYRQRFVEYNPNFVGLLKEGAGTNWAVYGVMAHEIGHHLEGHTLKAAGSRPDRELEADRYSGFILGRLGATLEEALKGMELVASDGGSETHPPKKKRLAAIARGWKRAKRKSTSKGSGAGTGGPAFVGRAGPRTGAGLPTEVDPAAPVGPTLTDSCVINGEPVVVSAEGLVLSRARGYLQVGRKLPPTSPNCVFMLQSNQGLYCVTRSGSVHFGSPTPVGSCRPCVNNICM